MATHRWHRLDGIHRWHPPMASLRSPRRSLTAPQTFLHITVAKGYAGYTPSTPPSAHHTTLHDGLELFREIVKPAVHRAPGPFSNAVIMTSEAAEDTYFYLPEPWCNSSSLASGCWRGGRNPVRAHAAELSRHACTRPFDRCALRSSSVCVECVERACVCVEAKARAGCACLCCLSCAGSPVLLRALRPN